MSDKVLAIAIPPRAWEQSTVRGLPIRVENASSVHLNITVSVAGARLVVTVKEHAPPTSTELKPQPPFGETFR